MQSRAYYAANADEINVRHRAYYAANAEKVGAQVRTYRAENTDRVRVWRLRQVYGMRPEDWAALWQVQDGRCYLCGDELGPGKKTHVDHDHSCCGPKQACSVCRRGLACGECNRTIGMARDDPDRLRRIADALEAAKRGVAERMASRESEQLTLL